MPKIKPSKSDFVFINKTLYKFSKNFFKKITHEILKETSFKKIPEFSLVLLGESDIKKINTKYRGKNKPTSVLTFPSKDFQKIYNNGESQLGDVFLCPEYIKKEIKKSRESFKYRLTTLFIHGIMHLLGFDHEKNKDALKMEAMERKIINKLNLKT